MRKDPLQSKIPKGKKTSKTLIAKSIENINDTELWEDLRTLRLEISREKGIPPFIIFHDKTLAEIVSYLPQTLDELSHIYGVGQKKLENYGRQFLDVVISHVQKHENKNPRPST